MEAPQWMFTKALSHKQKVLRLYKRALRECDNFHARNPLESRFHKVVLRSRFDDNADVKDTVVGRRLLAEGLAELWDKKHHATLNAPWGAYGINTGRCLPRPDHVLDTWTRMEQEQYPYLFNKRHASKKALIAHWDKIVESWDERLENLQREPPKEPATLAK